MRSVVQFQTPVVMLGRVYSHTCYFVTLEDRSLTRFKKHFLSELLTGMATRNSLELLIKASKILYYILNINMNNY